MAKSHLLKYRNVPKSIASVTLAGPKRRDRR